MRNIVLVCLSVFTSMLYAQVSVTVGPYLQSPTSNSIKIMWRTDSACVAKVTYGASPSQLTQTVTDTAVDTRHSILLTGLQPYTKYYYAVYADNMLLEGGDTEHWFRTFPQNGTDVPTRIWAIGDFGKGNTEQAKVRDAYLNFDTVETNVWLWLGDNAYADGTESEYLSKVFDSVYGYKQVMKHLPFLPCPGNHDYNSVSPITAPTPPLTHAGPYYDFVEVYRNAEAGGVASGHELFYSFDYGNIHFISLNSEIGSLFNQNDDWLGVYLFGSFNGSPMKSWLIQDLQANTKPWVIVYFHQPPYTDGSHEAGNFWEVYMKAMRENFASVWEQYGVDLVLCGHSHVYERSYLVKGAYGDVGDITPFNFIQNTSGIDAQGEAYIKYTQGTNANTGTVYVVNGNSGSKDDDPPFTHPYMYAEYGCDTCCGSLVIDINGNRLDGKHVDMNGNVRDHFTMYKINGPSNTIEAKNDGVFGNISIAPNPFSTKTDLYFDLPATKQVTVKLTDVNGKSTDVFTGELAGGKQQISIDAEMLKLSKGVYIVQLTADGKSTARTVLRLD